MRNCPVCHVSMEERRVQQATIDLCPRCAGVYLDPGEGQALGLDLGVLLSFSARPLGPSDRRCPDHSQPMDGFAVDSGQGVLTLERAGCCGGVFLDAGEAMAIGDASQVARSGPGPAPAAPATTPSDVKSCPSCRTALAPAQLHGFEVDECASCGHVFYEQGEAERAGIDTAALFADAPYAARRVGDGDPCPLGHGLMARYERELLGSSVALQYAACCHGLWIHKDAEKDAKRASRRSVAERADAQYSAGAQVMASAALRTPEEQLVDQRRADQTELLRHMCALQAIERARNAVRHGSGRSTR